MIEPSTVVRRSGDLVTAPLGQGLAMMDVESGTYFVLDDIGTFVWSRLAEAVQVAELLAELERLYDVTPEECERDVLALLGRMHAKGTVEIVG